MPTPDEEDDGFFESSEEATYRNILNGLVAFYNQADKPARIQEAAACLATSYSQPEILKHGDKILQALRVLVRENKLTQIDRYTFVATHKIPERTIDAEFPTYYQYTTPEKKPSNGLPSRREIIDSVATVATETFKGEMFTMDQLAKAWKKTRTKTQMAQLPAIFEIKSGVALFMYIVGCLVKRGFIEFTSEPNGFGYSEGYREVRKIDKSGWRDLDDSWVS